MEGGAELADQEGDERREVLLQADVERGEDGGDGCVAWGGLGDGKLLLEVQVDDVAAACWVVGGGMEVAA